MDGQLVAFSAAAAVVTVVPGADTMLVIRNGLAGGFRRGVVTAVGICCGVFVHATLVGLGMASFLAGSHAAFACVQILGAVYLAWLGLGALHEASIKREPSLPRPDTAPRAPIGPALQGLASNVLNPKVVLFYLAFLPQFVSPDARIFARVMLYATVHFVEGVVWLCMVAGLVAAGNRLENPTALRVLQGICGTAMLSISISLLLRAMF